MIRKLPIFRFLMEIYAMSDRWLSVEEIAEYLGVSNEICRHIALADFGNSKPMKLICGFGLVVQQRTKVEARNE
jgi:hypothetical protein